MVGHRQRSELVFSKPIIRAAIINQSEEGKCAQFGGNTHCTIFSFDRTTKINEVMILMVWFFGRLPSFRRNVSQDGLIFY